MSDIIDEDDDHDDHDDHDNDDQEEIVVHFARDNLHGKCE